MGQRRGLATVEGGLGVGEGGAGVHLEGVGGFGGFGGQRDARRPAGKARHGQRRRRCLAGPLHRLAEGGEHVGQAAGRKGQRGRVEQAGLPHGLQRDARTAQRGELGFFFGCGDGLAADAGGADLHGQGRQAVGRAAVDFEQAATLLH
jgi:hypothetical protein